jgi:hypothetical protein
MAQQIPTDKLHTTQMGQDRIIRNLSLDVDDVVDWCRNAVLNANSIIRRGKNYYVYYDNSIITINAHSNTIITAHILE